MYTRDHKADVAPCITADIRTAHIDEVGATVIPVAARVNQAEAHDYEAHKTGTLADTDVAPEADTPGHEA